MSIPPLQAVNMIGWSVVVVSVSVRFVNWFRVRFLNWFRVRFSVKGGSNRFSCLPSLVAGARRLLSRLSRLGAECVQREVIRSPLFSGVFVLTHPVHAL